MSSLYQKIFNDGYLGSHNDEERSEMRYAMRIADLRDIRFSNALGASSLACLFQCVWRASYHQKECD